MHWSAIYSFHCIIQNCKEFNILRCINFIDFKASFDSINREFIWKSFEHYGLPNTYIDMFKDFYGETEGAVRHKMVWCRLWDWTRWSARANYIEDDTQKWYSRCRLILGWRSRHVTCINDKIVSWDAEFLCKFENGVTHTSLNNSQELDLRTILSLRFSCA